MCTVAVSSNNSSEFLSEVVLVVRNSNVALFDIKRELLHEKLSEVTHDFSYSRSHYSALGFDLSHRVTVRETCQRSVIDVDATKLFT